MFKSSLADEQPLGINEQKFAINFNYFRFIVGS